LQKYKQTFFILWEKWKEQGPTDPVDSLNFLQWHARTLYYFFPS